MKKTNKCPIDKCTCSNGGKCTDCLIAAQNGIPQNKKGSQTQEVSK